jgi:uncharacterized membrane protein YccF (DUF307 family)
VRVYAYRSECVEFCAGRFCHHPFLAFCHAGEHRPDFHTPLTRSCWEITKLSFIPYGNEAIHVDELNPESKNALMNTGGTLLNILWLIFFGWWLCMMHIFAGIAQCITIIGIPVGIANFKIAAIALWPVGRRVVPVEVAQAAREANARRRFQ